VSRNHRRRITTIVTAVAAVTLTAALATACDPTTTNVCTS
jgi:hypothetical protein